MCNHAVFWAEPFGDRLVPPHQNFHHFDIGPSAGRFHLLEQIAQLVRGRDERAKKATPLERGMGLLQKKPWLADVEKEGIRVALVKTGSNIALFELDDIQCAEPFEVLVRQLQHVAALFIAIHATLRPHNA